MRTQVRIAIGLAAWLVLLIGPWLIIQQDGVNAAVRKIGAQLSDYLGGHRRVVPIRFEELTLLGRADPLFVIEAEGLRQVGEVRSLLVDDRPIPDRLAWVNAAEVMLYPSAPKTDEPLRITYRTTPQTLAWAVERLITPERQARMRAELQGLIREHRETISQTLLPALERQFRELSQIIEKELPPVLERHRPEVDRLCEKYNRVVVQDRLVPLVQDEIWPTVRTRTEPEVRAVGRELWQRVSLWRFGWRVLYDSTPLPDRNLTEREWNRFVEQEAKPVLERHTPEFVRTINEVLRDISQNPQVQGAVRQSLQTMAADPELRTLAQTIFREAITDNPRVREAIERQWRDPVLHDAVESIADRFEPTIRAWGDMVFGTRDEGITPEFAQIMRLQILNKDRRFLMLETGEELSVPTESLPPVIRALQPVIESPLGKAP